MSAFYDLSKTPRNILNQAIVRAIVSENNGALFDPSDLSTLYQDAAGTTPVTAVEQPVGKMLDKSGNGYHATQSITASRPTLSARKNLLLATETLVTRSVTTLAATYTLSLTGTGSVTLSGTATGTLTGTGTNRVSLTVTPTAGTLTLTVSGSVTKAQLEFGTTPGPYQCVNTATDYDTDERYFPKYLKFDGIDDYLSLPYMGLYAAGSASVVLARDSYRSARLQTTVSEGNNSTSMPFYNPTKRNANFASVTASIRDNSGAIITSQEVFPEVISALDVRSTIDTGSLITHYRNGVSGSPASYSRARSTLTLTHTTIGALQYSAPVVDYANMKVYGLIITKSALTDSQRVACERYLGRKSGVQL